jgi:hypothetical protein
MRILGLGWKRAEWDPSRPRASTQRIVPTSRGVIKLNLMNFFGRLHVGVDAFDDEGWEEGGRALGWSEDAQGGRGYVERGGRATLAEAIAEVAGIPPDEADRIAAETLEEWPRRLDAEDRRSADEARRVFYLLAGALVVLVAALVTLAAVLLVLLLR